MQLPLPQLPSFDYVRPNTLEEAARILLEDPQGASLFAGGTDLLIRIRSRDIQPALLVDVKHIPELTAIEFNPDTGFRIGAAVPMNAVMQHADLAAHCPLLVEALDTVASYHLRNRATIGGNLCNASPAADSAPACLVLEAQLILWSPSGERTIPTRDFFKGPGNCILERGELLKEIVIPPQPPGWRGRYLKLGRNTEGDLAIVGAAVMGYPDEQSSSGYRFRLALGSVASTPIRVPDAEVILASEEITPELISKAGEAAMRTAKPIDDIRASARYRSAMVAVLIERAIASVWHALQEAR